MARLGWKLVCTPPPWRLCITDIELRWIDGALPRNRFGRGPEGPWRPQGLRARGPRGHGGPKGPGGRERWIDA